MRYSRQRELVAQIVSGRKDHPTADVIYLSAREIEPNISLGTVYRNLSKLSDENVIIKLGLGTSVEHFDGNPMPHYHVMCTECGAIDDIEAEPLDELNNWASKLFKGEIYKHSAIFFGKCEKCKN